MVGAAIVLSWVLVALLAPLIAPFGPNATLVPYQKPWTAFAGNSVVPPGRFWLGTDNLGRDILSRLIYGTRVSIAVALAGTLIGAAFGLILGLIAAHVRGLVDTAISLATSPAF